MHWFVHIMLNDINRLSTFRLFRSIFDLLSCSYYKKIDRTMLFRKSLWECQSIQNWNELIKECWWNILWRRINTREMRKNMTTKKKDIRWERGLNLLTARCYIVDVFLLNKNKFDKIPISKCIDSYPSLRLEKVNWIYV